MVGVVCKMVHVFAGVGDILTTLTSGVCTH